MSKKVDPVKVRSGPGHRAFRRQRDSLRHRTERDHLPCWLCGEPIDTSLPRTDPMSFSADHVQAIAEGGGLNDEIRPSHNRCNGKRGRGTREKKQISMRTGF